MINAVTTFKDKMQKRFEQNFFGAVTASKLQGLDDPNLANKLKNEFIDFYTRMVNYINKWFCVDNYPCSTDWLMLKLNIKYDEVQSLRKAMAAKRLACGTINFVKIVNMVSRLRGAEGA
uniref:Uncharacterized protein n=1 Tax=Romanomermis culicivorax TaxID=13658 RepID=A0A915K3R4_ROMCU